MGPNLRQRLKWLTDLQILRSFDQEFHKAIVLLWLTNYQLDPKEINTYIVSFEFSETGTLRTTRVSKRDKITTVNYKGEHIMKLKPNHIWFAARS